MLFILGEKKIRQRNNIGGALPLGWWSGKWVALKIGSLRSRRWESVDERHVNKPLLLSKCWRKQVGTFWIVIRLITACDLHPKKRDDLLWQKAKET
jgi:hypothetical protein